MKVLVCGGRDYSNKDYVWGLLDQIHEERAVDMIIHGACRGADEMAFEWSKWWSVNARAFPPDWSKHGKAAGPIRNQQMIDEGKPDLVVAFPGGRGTADMTRRARAAGIEVVEA